MHALTPIFNNCEIFSSHSLLQSADRVAVLLQKSLNLKIWRIFLDPDAELMV